MASSAEYAHSAGPQERPVVLAYIKQAEYTKDDENMRLKEGKDNGIYIVERIETEQNLERRLEALGLTEGSRIEVLNNDKKGAMTVRFRGTRFAIGKRIADHIIVREAAA